jgi:hypothetical protein
VTGRSPRPAAGHRPPGPTPRAAAPLRRRPLARPGREVGGPLGERGLDLGQQLPHAVRLPAPRPRLAPAATTAAAARSAARCAVTYRAPGADSSAASASPRRADWSMLSTVGATPGCRGLTSPRPIRISADSPSLLISSSGPARRDASSHLTRPALLHLFEPKFVRMSSRLRCLFEDTRGSDILPRRTVAARPGPLGLWACPGG